MALGVIITTISAGAAFFFSGGGADGSTIAAILIGIYVVSVLVRPKNKGGNSALSTGEGVKESVTQDTNNLIELVKDTETHQQQTKAEENETEQVSRKRGETPEVDQEAEDIENRIAEEISEIENIENLIDKDLSGEKSELEKSIKQGRKAVENKKEEKNIVNKLGNVLKSISDPGKEELENLKDLTERLDNIRNQEAGETEKESSESREVSSIIEDARRKSKILLELTEILDEEVREEAELEKIGEILRTEKLERDDLELEAETEELVKKLELLIEKGEKLAEDIELVAETDRKELKINQELSKELGLTEKEREKVVKNLKSSGDTKIKGDILEMLKKLGAELEEIEENLEEQEQEESSEESRAEAEGEEIEKSLGSAENKARTVKDELEELEEETQRTSPRKGFEKEPWMLVAKNPNVNFEWDKVGPEFWKDGWEWSKGWIKNGRVNASQGWKIHIAVNPENQKEVFQVAKAILPILDELRGRRKIARSGENLLEKAKKEPETRPKLATIYPGPDKGTDIVPDKGTDIVNQNKRNTETIISGLIDRLSERNLLGMTEKIQTVGEFNITFNGKNTRIFVRYDKLTGNKIKDNSGRPYEFTNENSNKEERDRQPGALPDGYARRANINLEGLYMDELPRLEPLKPKQDISMVLPKNNIE